MPESTFITKPGRTRAASAAAIASSLLALLACAGADESQTSDELEAYLTGELALDRADALNRELARAATRGSGYAASEVEPPDDEWFPVIELAVGASKPADVSAWLDAGDIRADGSFAPCLAQACPEYSLTADDRTALAGWAHLPCFEARARMLAGAVRRLSPASEIVWSEDAAFALAVDRERERSVLNPRALALLSCDARPETEPGAFAAEQSADSRAGADTGPETLAEGADDVARTAAPGEPDGASRRAFSAEADVARNHEPPDSASQDSGGGCDCGDIVSIDCNGSSDEPDGSSSNCAVRSVRGSRQIRTEWIFALAALGWLARRRTRHGSKAALRAAKHAASGLVALALLGWPEPARAADAASALSAGREHLARKDYPKAIAELEAARAAGAGPEVLEPLAQAYEGAGNLPGAFAMQSERAQLIAESGGAQPPALLRALTRLKGQVASVEVSVTPEHAELWVDGQRAFRDARTGHVILAPGSHQLTARAPGYFDAQQSVEASAGAALPPVRLELALGSTLIVTGFAPDALIAIDGSVVGTGTWQGVVAPGAHLVQVYRPGGPQQDYPVTLLAGQVQRVPATAAEPPAGGAAAEPAPVEPQAPAASPRRYRTGPYVLGQIGFVVPTTEPDGFRYPLTTDEDTGELREESGAAGFAIGATGGYRLARAIGVGGFVLYARTAADGTIEQLEELSDGSLVTHEGPADYVLQSLLIGPHVRFMAGGDRARFLGGFAFGAQHLWLDLTHVNVVVQGDTLVEQGNFQHEESGWGQFVAFDLGAEFNIGDALLLGVAMDILIASTQNVSSDPYGDTAMGYVGLSARVGWHGWTAQ